jgi:hypothetical protein
MWHAWEKRGKCTRFWWEGKRPLGRPRHRREDGIRMDLREWLGGRVVDPVDTGCGPVAGFCEYSDEPVGSGATELVG